MHSPCSSFNIDSTGDEGRHSNYNNNGNGTSAAAPWPVGWGGEGSPEVENVAAVRPGGKATYLTPGALLSLADNNGDGDNGRGKGGGGDEDEVVAAA